MKKLVGLMLLPLTLWARQDDAGTALLKAVDEVLAQVTRLRGLEVKARISKGVKSREEIRTYLVSRFEGEYSQEELVAEAKVLAKLGLIPKDYRLYESTLELLTDQAVGFYDPDSRTFHIADWIGAELQRPVMAHELTHALQDQHFRAGTFLKRVPGNDDATLARLAVIEGEALAIMLDYILYPLGKDFLEAPDLIQTDWLALGDQQSRVFAAAPMYLKESLLFPYTYGVRFLRDYRRGHSWSEVARVYADLPRSTEQILHPGKYLTERDDPTSVDVGSAPAALEPGWRRIYANVLGEFGTYLALKQFVDEKTARLTAEGWDGDTLQLYESPDGRLALLLRLVWDSDREASEFTDAYRQLIPVKYPSARLENDASPWRWSAAGHRISLELVGRHVEVVEFEDASTD